MKLVFLHIPKTAGTSLKTALRQSVDDPFTYVGYHSDSLYYPLFLASLESLIRYSYQRNAGCTAYLQHLWQHTAQHQLPAPIFGHLNMKRVCTVVPNGWERSAGYTYITFMRHPLQRAISHYYYNREHNVSPDLRRRFCQEYPSLKDFLFSPRYANLQTRYMLVPQHFDFIGITEHMTESLAALRAHTCFSQLGVPQHTNRTQTKDTEEIDALTPEIKDEFRHTNSEDYYWYETAYRRLQDLNYCP